MKLYKYYKLCIIYYGIKLQNPSEIASKEARIHCSLKGEIMHISVPIAITAICFIIFLSSSVIKFKKIIPVSVLIIGVLSLMFARSLNVFKTPTLILSNDGVNTRLIMPFTTFRLSNYEKVIPFNFVAKSELTVHPVTENPKVRNLAIKVTASVARDIKEAIKLYEYFQSEDKPGSVNNTEELLKFYLYEFAEVKSKELAVLYNPLDDEQQAKLYEMFALYLKEKIKDLPISLQSVRFDILP